MKRMVVIAVAAAFAMVLGGAMLDLPLSAINLRIPVAANMGESGVSHPVTAVLLNYRGYDTLLEIAVLLLFVQRRFSLPTLEIVQHNR